VGELAPSAATSPEASLRRRATVAGQALAAAVSADEAAGLAVVADSVVADEVVDSAVVEAAGAVAQVAAAGADNPLQRRALEVPFDNALSSRDADWGETHVEFSRSARTDT